MGKARTMTAGARLTNKVNTADNNYGDKKNGGASTVGVILPTTGALAARVIKNPYVIAPRGGLIMGGAGMLHVNASRFSDGFNFKLNGIFFNYF